MSFGQKYNVEPLSDAEIEFIQPTISILNQPKNQIQVLESVLEKCPNLSEAFVAIPQQARQASFMTSMYKRGVHLMCQHDHQQLFEIFSRHPAYKITIEHMKITNECVLDLMMKELQLADDFELVIKAWKHFQSNVIDIMTASYAKPETNKKLQKKNRQRIFRSVTVEDIETVQQTWATIVEVKEEASNILARLLSVQVNIVKVFHSHSIDVAGQSAVIFEMLNKTIGKLDDIDDLIPWLRALGVKHMQMNVGPQLLASMKPILVSLFKDCLGFGFDAQRKESWQRVAGFVIGMMIEGCRQADRGSVASSLCDNVDSEVLGEQLSGADIQICQDTWNEALKVIDSAVDSFYKDLISSKAEIRNLFSQSNMREQSRKLVRAIGGVINLLQEQEELQSILEELGRRHVYYGVLPRHFKYLKFAWFRMIKGCLALKWTPKVSTSWNVVWSYISHIMKTSLQDALLLYTPPDPEKIKLKILINHIDRIQTQNMSFYADFWYAAYTCDNPSQSAAFGPDVKDPNNDPALGYQPKERPCWNIVPLNGMDVEEQFRANRDKFLRKYDDGKWYMRGQFRGTFSQPFDLHSFPIDHHVLKLNFSLQVDETLGVFDEENVISRLMPFKVDTMAGTDWEVLAPRIYTHTGSAVEGGSASGKRYNHCILEIPISRIWHHHIWETFLPLFLIEIFAWSVYFADIHPMAKRMGVVTTLLLTLFAFKWTVQENMPPTPYLTLMDHFFNLGKFFMLLHIIGQVFIVTFEEIEILNMLIAGGLLLLFLIIHSFLFLRMYYLIKLLPKKTNESALAMVAKSAKFSKNVSMGAGSEKESTRMKLG